MWETTIKLFYKGMLLVLFMCLFNPLQAQPAYIFHEKGVEKMEGKSYTEAIKDFDIAIQKDKNHAPSYCDKARALIELGKNEEALKNFEMALKLKDNYVNAYYYRALFYYKLKDPKALADFSKTIQLDPQKADAYLKRGLIHFNNQQENEALLDFNKVIDLGGGHAQLYYYRGLILVKKGKTNEALNDFNEALTQNPTLSEAQLERGKIYLSQKKTQMALTDFNACIANRINTESVYTLRAECNLLLGKTDDALRDYNTLIDVFKTKDIKVYQLHAEANFKKKDWPATIKDCNKMVSLNRDHIPAYLLRAQVYTLQGKSKYPLALNDYKRVCETDSKNLAAWEGRGNMLFLMAKYTEALDCFNKSIGLNPSANAYYIRSKCYYKLNNKKACCSDLEKAAQMGNTEAKKDLGVVCI